MKRILTILMAAMLLLTCGCSLARPEPQVDALITEDRLIGVLITTEYLDLFDMEAWLNDNIGSITDGKAVIDGDTRQYEGRIYAERIEEEYTAFDGSVHTRTDFRFPEALGGEALICPTLTDEDGFDYTCSINGRIFSDTHTHVKSSDAGTGIELSATVYYDPLTIRRESINALYEDGTEGVEQHICFYHNPVYQTPTGEVYVTSGSGHSHNVDDDISPYGDRSSFYLTQSFSSTVNGETQTVDSSVTVNMESVRYAEKFVILEMSADNKLLHMSEYTPDTFPHELTVGSDTAYVIAETHSRGEQDEPIISRQVCTADSEDERLTLLIPVGDGYAAKLSAKVIAS